ncbi:MAG: CIA30 family protein [Bacteroidota bacterium]
MKLFGILMILNFATFTNHKISFQNESEIANWSITNDGVMGGLSKGGVSASDKGMIFFGEVSLKNFGGFTSYKSPFSSYDLSEVKKVQIRYRSTGHDMGFQLETSKQFFQPYYKANLPVSEDWTVITLELSEFNQYQMGDKTRNRLTEKELKNIVRYGFITNEKKEGAFKFEIDYIHFL